MLLPMFFATLLGSLKLSQTHNHNTNNTFMAVPWPLLKMIRYNFGLISRADNNSWTLNGWYLVASQSSELTIEWYKNIGERLGRTGRRYNLAHWIRGSYNNSSVHDFFTNKINSYERNDRQLRLIYDTSTSNGASALRIWTHRVYYRECVIRYWLM